MNHEKPTSYQRLYNRLRPPLRALPDKPNRPVSCQDRNRDREQYSHADNRNIAPSRGLYFRTTTAHRQIHSKNAAAVNNSTTPEPMHRAVSISLDLEFNPRFKPRACFRISLAMTGTDNFNFIARIASGPNDKI